MRKYGSSRKEYEDAFGQLPLEYALPDKLRDFYTLREIAVMSNSGICDKLFNFMKLFLSFIVIYMSVVSAHPARFPLGENDIIQWNDAVTSAHNFDFLITSSLDIISIYGNPGTIRTDSDGSFVYFYHCPSNLPKFVRMRQRASERERERIWICLAFHFNKDKMLESTEVTLRRIPERQ